MGRPFWIRDLLMQQQHDESDEKTRRRGKNALHGTTRWRSIQSERGSGITSSETRLSSKARGSGARGSLALKKTNSFHNSLMRTRLRYRNSSKDEDSQPLSATSLTSSRSASNGAPQLGLTQLIASGGGAKGFSRFSLQGKEEVMSSIKAARRSLGIGANLKRKKKENAARKVEMA